MCEGRRGGGREGKGGNLEKHLGGAEQKRGDIFRKKGLFKLNLGTEKDKTVDFYSQISIKFFQIC